MRLRGLHTLRLGVTSLGQNKLRSFLTALGLLFGVASVIAMLAVGEGAHHEALAQIESLGPTNLMVRSQRPPVTQQTSQGNRWQAFSYGLAYADADKIRATLPHATDVVQVRETPQNLRRGEFWSSSIVVGTAPEYARVMGLGLAEGRWLSSVDVDRFENVAVLGAAAADVLFPVANPIGATFHAGDVQFSVVGVLAEVGREASPGGTPLDQCVFVPLSTSRARFGDLIVRVSTGNEERTRLELSEIKVRFASVDEVLPAAKLVARLLAIGARPQDDVKLIVPLELLRQREATARIFNLVLGSIAVISLLVGGIGIMNVMLATVTERTREIGIRRALGAKRRSIVHQFLVETVLLSCCGGLAGVGLGIAIPSLVTAVSGNLTIIRLEHVVLAFGISAAVGISFGLYPAWRAAHMDPVEALRHE